MKITLDYIHEENYNVSSFWFKPEKKIEFTAGQFIELFIPHEKSDDRGIKRWFTLSSSPTDELISITTKNYGDKASSFKKRLFNSKPGDEFKIVEPMGDFVLPIDTSIPLVFIAGGIGLTPFHSMVKWLTDKGIKRQIQILMAFNQPKDVIFEDLFRNYGAEIKIIVSSPNENWQGNMGNLSASKILELTGNNIDNKKYYISGPEPMVESLEPEMHKLGITKSQLVLDFFPGYELNLQ